MLKTLTDRPSPTPRLCQLDNRIVPNKIVITVLPYSRPIADQSRRSLTLLLSTINAQCKGQLKYTFEFKIHAANSLLSLPSLSQFSSLLSPPFSTSACVHAREREKYLLPLASSLSRAREESWREAISLQHISILHTRRREFALSPSFFPIRAISRVSGWKREREPLHPPPSLLTLSLFLALSRLSLSLI